MGYPKPRARAAHHIPAPGESALRRQAPPQRLAALQFTHARLLKAIAAKKKSLEKLDAQIEETSRRLVTLGPVRDQLIHVDQEIHKLFKALLARKRQPREVQRGIRLMYEFLQQRGTLSPPGLWDEDPPDFFAAEPEAHDDHAGHASGSGPVPPAGAGGFSAKRPTDASPDQSLRALFRRLALAVHPDRVPDEAEKARRTDAMKEISRAYAEGDVACLLDLERKWMTGEARDEDPVDDLERTYTQLERTNRDLAIQLKTLTAELRAMRRSPPGQMNDEVRRTHRNASDPIEAMLDELKDSLSDIEDLRDFVVAYTEGRLPFDDFLDGPELRRTKGPAAGGDAPSEEDMLADLFGDFLDDMGAPEFPARTGQRRAASGRKRAGARGRRA